MTDAQHTRPVREGGVEAHSITLNAFSRSNAKYTSLNANYTSLERCSIMVLGTMFQVVVEV